MENSNNNNQPDLIAYTVTGTKDKGFWTRTGAAWSNSKGGFNIKLDALPVNGELVLLPPKEQDEQQ